MIRLLLVEDDPTSRSFLHAAASALPAEVDVAGSLAEARLLAAHAAYDAWLIDAHLPDGSGTELLGELRATGAGTPAIAHTATQEPDALEALRSAGFALALSKPLSPGAWQAAIRRVLGDSDASIARGRPSLASAAVWNPSAGLAAVGGHVGNARALRDLFLGELPGVRDNVIGAAQASDATAMRHALHRLRASCGFVGADSLGAASAGLHEAPHSADALDAFRKSVAATLAQD